MPHVFFWKAESVSKELGSSRAPELAGDEIGILRTAGILESILSDAIYRLLAKDQSARQQQDLEPMKPPAVESSMHAQLDRSPKGT